MNLTFRDLQDKLRDPAMTALLVLGTAVMFVMSPLRAVGVGIPPTVVVPLVFLIITVVVLLSRSKGAIALVLGAVVLNLTGTLMHQANPSAFTGVLRALGEVTARSALGWVVAVAVFAPGKITHFRVQGAVVLYLNFAMIFIALYRLLAEISPGAFQGLATEPNDPGFVAALTYFSLSALTTAGFGDIVPLHPFARCLANLEAIIGQLYPATLLARIVTLELAHRRVRGRPSRG
jgi:hypothetical protein